MYASWTGGWGGGNVCVTRWVVGGCEGWEGSCILQFAVARVRLGRGAPTAHRFAVECVICASWQAARERGLGALFATSARCAHGVHGVIVVVPRWEPKPQD